MLWSLIWPNFSECGWFEKSSTLISVQILAMNLPPSAKNADKYDKCDWIENTWQSKTGVFNRWDNFQVMVLLSPLPAFCEDKADALLTAFYIFAGQATQFNDPKQFSIKPWRTGWARWGGQGGTRKWRGEELKRIYRSIPKIVTRDGDNGELKDNYSTF